jgi:hypothetical protein
MIEFFDKILFVTYVIFMKIYKKMSNNIVLENMVKLFRREI